MKKPSLSKDGIQQFFLANGEKLLLGITMVILLGFFYSALTAKPLDESNSPEAIKTASNSLQSQVGNELGESGVSRYCQEGVRAASSHHAVYRFARMETAVVS
jgi:hypothetical protein